MKNNYLHLPCRPPFYSVIRWAVVLLAGLLPLASIGQTISGTVFRDFNSNGVYDTAPASTTFTELGLAGIEVRIFNASGVNVTPGSSVTTSASGAYTVIPTQATGPYRIEFTIPASLDHFYNGTVSTSQGTSIQFVASAPATVNFAVNYPKDYCQSNPDLAVACFVSGDPIATGSSVASEDAIVKVPYGIANASTISPTHLADASEVGSVWGAAYQRTSKKLFTAAFLKRHVGLGKLGLGGIYTTNMVTSPTSTTYADLEALGIDLGASLLGTRNLPAVGTTSNNDATAFDLVGKIGLGGVALSDDESKLYVIDLFNKKLLILNIGNPAKSSLTAADIQQITLPAPVCVGGVARPFAVNVGNGKVYVGIVCSGENSVNSGNANLDGYVYEMDPATNVFNSTPILTIPLDYTKGRMHTGHPEMGNTWSPWANSFAQLFRGGSSTAGARIGRAQPMLSNIAFTDNGDMLMAFMDRGGHQLGYRNRNTTDTKATPDTLYNGYISGDLLRARYNGSAWVMESNGRVAATTTQALLSGAGTSNSQGPGGGEFYANDVYADASGDIHQETIEGGIAVIPGTNHVVATVMDPLDIWSGGFSWFNNTNGNDTKRYQIYLTVGTGSNPVTYGKANGLGVIAAVCDPAPIQVGNRVWNDLNNNGIQDPGEPALAGVPVLLKGPGLPTGGVSVTTNSSGEYYFSSRTAANATGFANSLSLTYGGSYSLTFPTSTSSGALLLSSKPNSATGTNPDQIDTDPNLAGLVSFTLGLPGQNDFTYDAAYFQPASLGDYVFIDTNKDGIQNSGDTPLAGVTVTLYQNGSAVATTTTNASGLYSFTGLASGTSNSYVVGFATPTGYTATITNVGSDTADSDANPITGLTQSVTLAPGENNPTLDAGFYLLPASLGDYVFLDANKDGIQNTGDAPILGVTVTLYRNGTAVASTTTNASGLYSFTGLTPGTSNSYVVGFTTPAGYTATISNVGSDTVDSDANPATGKTQSVTLAPGEYNPTLDAGFYLIPASLGDYTFIDTNKDGIQNVGDVPLPDVTVTLYQNGSAVASTTTNASGLYSFTGLTPGTSNSYVVGFTAPAGYTATITNVGSDTADSDASPVTGKTQSVTLAPGEYNPTLDAGFYLLPAALGDYVFVDTNKDGIQNAGDVPMAGVTVTLYQNGSAVATTTTNSSGLYSFTGLAPGTSNSYVVGFTAPAGFIATLTNVGSDTADSDADPITGKTQSVTLAPGETNPTLDAGFYLPTAGLGDYVFEDKNANGIQDAGDVALPGVLVTLYSSGTVVGTTTTNTSGLYSFTGLTPGTPYVVGFGQPVGYVPTLVNVGNDGLDSDAAVATGLTSAYSLTINEFNPTIDAGFYKLASLGDYVFNDKNRDGIQNAGDTPIPGVLVTLFQNGSAVATTTTDATGLYSFTGLTPGSSISYVVGFTAPSGYSTTSPLSGTDATKDSNADPVTGRTSAVTLASGENNPTIDAGFYQPTAGLGDYVFDDKNANGIQDTGDVPISGVTVTLYTNGSAIATTTTNASGLYSFTGLTPGTPYVVGFAQPVGYVPTLVNVGNDGLDSDAAVATGLTGVYSLTADEFNPTVDAGFYKLASLGDYVFNDTNRNGIQNTGDTPIPGVTVTLFQNGSAVATTTTDANGLYSFTGLTPGTSNVYSVGFTKPAGFASTSANIGFDGLDSDADPTTGMTAGLTLTSGENNTSVDAGYYLPTASLGDFVFEDVNKDGLQDAGDLPIAGAVVTLFQSGSVAGTTTTDGNGLYSFTGLTPGIPYSVSFTTPEGFSAATTSNAGGDEAIDSDPVGGVTAPVTLTAGENNPTLDAGFVRATVPPATYAIAKTVNKKRVELGQLVTYTISLTNTSATAATNVMVTDAFSSTGLTIVGSATTSSGTFTPSLTGGSWSIPTLASGQVVTLSFQAQSTAAGLAYNVATAPDGTTATACLTVPFHVCENSDFEFLLSAPASFSTYQWAINGTPIPGATSATLSVTAVGEYTVATTNAAGCPDGSCCPFVVVADPAPSLTATAVAATCTGSTPNNDASITLVGSSTNAVSYNISQGTSFTASAPLFATDQPLAGIALGGVLKAGLANPVSAPGTSYTIRVYSAEGCYSDVVVVVPPAQCQCPPVKCAPIKVRRVTSR